MEQQRRRLGFAIVLSSWLVAGGVTSCAALTSWDGYVDGTHPGSDGASVDVRPGMEAGSDTQPNPPQDSTVADGQDSAVVDAPEDSTVTDTQPNPGDSAAMNDTTPLPPADSAPADSNAPPDSSADTSVADTNVADTSVADTNVADTNVADSATATFTVGGTISGLFSQDSLQLALNGTKQLFSPPDFTFAMPVANGGAYAVTVAMNPQMPISETCTIMKGTGTIQSANVTDVAVKCLVSSYTIGGTVTGYTGTGLQLGDGTDTITVSGADAGTASFVFPALPSGDSYAVAVVTAPSGPSEYCSVTASGMIVASNVTNVQVTCVPVPACSPACTDGAGCVLSGDCASAVCSSGTCQAPACAPSCAPGAACGADSDCLSGTCTVPTCQ